MPGSGIELQARRLIRPNSFMGRRGAYPPEPKAGLLNAEKKQHVGPDAGEQLDGLMMRPGSSILHCAGERASSSWAGERAWAEQLHVSTWVGLSVPGSAYLAEEMLHLG
ncbi:hypothetical protein Droror1_Dr00025217 [Drosera rotundifolia]